MGQFTSRGFRPGKMRGVCLTGLGSALLLVAGSYYAYSVVKNAGMDDLSYTIERPSRPRFSPADVFVQDVQTDGVQDPSGVQLQDGGHNTVDGNIFSAGYASAVSVEEDRNKTVHSAAGVVELQGSSPIFVNAGLVSGVNGVVNRSEMRDASPATQVVPGKLALDSVEVGNDDSNRIVASLHTDSTAGAGTVFGQVEPNDRSFLDDGQEVVAYTDKEIGRSGLSSADRMEMNAEVAQYLPPGPIDANMASLSVTRLRIPIIDVDADVNELEVVLRDNVRSWDTPKMVVGHIPSTARPGEYGQGWYFGHLESLIRREGNVFQRLPEIPRMLVEGEQIYVFLETSARKYLYQVYKTDWIHQDDLLVTDSGRRDITLVTCYPRLIYDHRVLVTAALVGVRKS